MPFLSHSIFKISITTKQLLIVGTLLIASKFVALLKEIYLAHTFGMGYILDTYFIAFSTSQFLPAVFMAVIPAVLVPYFVKLDSKTRKRVLLGNLSLFSILLGLVNAILLLYFSGDISSGFKYVLGTNEHFLVTYFINYFSLLPLPIILMSVFSSYLLSVRSNANSVIEIIPNLVLIMAVFLFSASFAEKSLAVGTITGIFLHAFGLILVCIVTYNAIPSFAADEKARIDLKFIAKGGMILFFGQFFMSFLAPLDNYFAVSFGEGSVAIYNYAMKLIGIGTSLISVVIMRVVLPKFSELERDGKYLEMRHLALIYSSVSFVGISIACLLVFPFIPLFIEFIYQRGNLTPQVLILISDLVLAGMFQLPIFVSALIIVQCFLAKNWVILMTVFAISNVVVKFLSNLIFTEIFGLSGLMYSWATMYFWSGLCLFTFLLKNNHAESV